MRLFLDTNVLIDFLLERHPFNDAAASLVSYAAENQLEICTSALTIVERQLYLCRAFQDASQNISHENRFSPSFLDSDTDKLIRFGQRLQCRLE